MDNYINPNDTVPSVFDELQRPEYATTGQRFVNYLVDLVVIYIASIAFGIFLGLLAVMTKSESINSLLYSMQTSLLVRYGTGCLLSFLTYSIIEGLSKGRTLGKLVTRTRAVREDGEPFTWQDAIMRSLCRIVPFEPFSALGGHPWHDGWSKTAVVKIP